MTCTTCRDRGYVTPQGRKMVCPDCRPCLRCDGRGRVWPSKRERESEAGMLSRPCRRCKGSGRTVRLLSRIASVFRRVVAR